METCESGAERAASMRGGSRTRILSFVALAAALMLSTSCAKKRPATLPPFIDQSSDANAWLIHVNYATDRNIVGTRAGKPVFGGDRGDLVTGHATVSIPRLHETGEIELPSYWRLEFNPDPAKHFVIVGSSRMGATPWMEDIRQRVARSADKSALVFIHGYNVSFDDALLRTAQIEHDIAFKGATLLFSWPSAAQETAYPRDEENVRWAVPHLLATMRSLLANSGATKIVLIAHSMGNRVLTDVLAQIAASDPTARSRIREVILAAPDIDAEIFLRDIAPRVAAATQRTTLYASSKDWALTASRRFHGYRRAGDTQGGVTIATPIQTIDATSAADDMLGHSYIGDSRFVLSDVGALIRDGKAPQSRGMIGAGNPSARYWRFPAPR